jgi:hypothetical protein
MREEVAREALKEGLTPGLPMQEKTTKVPIQVEAADANVLPCIDVVMWTSWSLSLRMHMMGML